MKKNSPSPKSDKPKPKKSAPQTRPQTQRKFEPEDIAKRVYFDVRDSGYWFQLQGRWVKLGVAELDDEFRALGLRDDPESKRNGLDELRWVKRFSRHHCQIEFAGPLAGYRKGYDNRDGRPKLVTEEAHAAVFAELPKKVATRPDWIWRFLEELLGHDQAMVFCYWSAFALIALRRGDFSPGQALVLVGDSGCGKSLLQYVVTVLIGGRVADPMDYLTGKTNFNKKMTEAEHWQVEDLQSGTEGKQRRNFGEVLKRCVINERFTIHAKGKDSIDAPLFRRITLSVNRELENLGKLPPMDGSLLDKITFLLCNKAERCFAEFIDAERPELLPKDRAIGKPDRLLIQKKIASEIEQFRAWLLTGLPSLAADAQDPRMGIRAFHHPELFAELSSVDPWERMLQLVDAILWGDPEDAWKAFEGKAIELEEKLREGSRFSFEVDKILRGANACGSYLGRLMRRYPSRISNSVNTGHTFWTIKPPVREKK